MKLVNTKQWIVGIAVISSTVLGGNRIQAQTPTQWDRIGTGAVVGQIVGETAASAIKWHQGDKKPLLRDICSLSLADGIAQGLKWSIHVERPDGSDNQSFPSMHSSSAMAMAARGSGWSWQLSVPLAGLIGISRTPPFANKHELVRDVIPGLFIGGMARWACGKWIR